jgi:hypothetical protein
LLFQTVLPSPSQITINAGNLYHYTGRIFPNHGLEVEETCKAIESVGLVSELQNKDSFLRGMYFTPFIYSYLYMGLPILVGFYIPTYSANHLVTFCGYKEKPYAEVWSKISSKKLKSLLCQNEEVNLYSNYIDSYYAHDDQIGPFSKTIIGPDNEIKTAYQDTSGKDLYKAQPRAVIVPVYHKIRITFFDIHSRVGKINCYLNDLNLFPSDQLLWDIYLDYSNHYKENVFSESVKFNEVLLSEVELNSKKFEIRTESLPRFVWIARLIVEGFPMIDFIFDATEIADSKNCIKVVYYYNELIKLLPVIIQKSNLFEISKEVMGEDIVDKLINDAVFKTI